MGALPGENGSIESLSASAPAPFDGTGEVQSKSAAAKAKKTKHRKKQCDKNAADDDACLEAAFQEARRQQQPTSVGVAASRALCADNALKKCGGFKAKSGENFKATIVTEAACCGLCGVSISAPAAAAVTPKGFVCCLSSRCVPRFVLKALDAEAAIIMKGERQGNL